MIKLRFESLDDEPEEREFSDIEEAIKWASAWFADGYVDLYETNPSLRGRVSKDVERLEKDLRAGDWFYCGRFYEKITFVGDGQSTSGSEK